MSSATPTLAPRAPDGWIFGFSRYRNYVLFAATAVFMAIACVLLLLGVRALAAGPEAWAGYLALLRTPALLALDAVVLLFTLYFALRFGWVGRKIPAGGRLGPIPLAPRAIPMALLGLANAGAFVTVWLVVLLVLGGVIP